MRSRVSYERNPSGRSQKGSWGRKDQEYMADFELTAKRVLDPWHLKLFRYHFVLGANAAMCCCPTTRPSISPAATWRSGAIRS